MASQASRKHATEAPVIPDRLYFKIGDVARICGVEAYVLRFWETQFPHLKPNKSGTGQRLYRRRDVELVLEIQRLLHKEGFTIPGARQALEQRLARCGPPRAHTRDAPAGGTIDAARPDAAKGHRPRPRGAKEIAAMLANPQPGAKRERAKVVRFGRSRTACFRCEKPPALSLQPSAGISPRPTPEPHPDVARSKPTADG